MFGAQRYTRKLSQKICLLVRQGAAAEDTNCVRAVAPLFFLKSLHDTTERFVPGNRQKRSIRLSSKRREEAIWMRERGWRGPSLDAETALVDGEGSIACHFRLFARSLQMDTTLKGTIR